METYQVDGDTMGTEWRGDREDLQRFCEILQAMIDGVTVEAVDWANNPAEDGPGLVPEATWNKALDAHYEENPKAWAC